MSVIEKYMFSEELEVIKKLERLEADLSKVTVRSPLAVSEVALVPELDFSLGYLLEYLKDFFQTCPFFSW